MSGFSLDWTVVGIAIGVGSLFVGRYGWRLFGFDMCMVPSVIDVQEITVTENNVSLKGSATNSSLTYVGFIHKIKDDQLYVGLKYNKWFGFLSLMGPSKKNENFDASINCDTKTFSKIYFANKTEEKQIWQKK